MGELMTPSPAPEKSPEDAALWIRDSRPQIIADWERQIADRMPASLRQDRTTMIDALPEFLDQLVDVLLNDSPSEALARRENSLAVQHGVERVQFDEFHLKLMMDEYRALQRALIGGLERAGRLGSEARDIILESVQIAQRNSGNLFSELRSLNREESIHKERKKELSRTEFFYRGIIDGVEDYAIFTLDPRGVVTTWNLGAARMKRYKAEEIIGQHFSILYTEDARDRDEAMEHLRQALERGRFRGEGVRVKKGGEPFLADVLITPLYQDKELIGYTKVVADLTERTNLMQERDLSRSQIEDLESERDLREKFVAGITHDLRNPLTAARMSAQLTLRQKDDPAAVSLMCARIVENLNRVDSMIQNLLDASRIRAGHRIPMNFTRCILNDVIRSTLDQLASIHGDRFVLRSDEPIQGYWDPMALQRVTENLCTNAVKYGSTQDPITLTLTETHNQVQLAVHNRGNPIPTSDHEKLFQAFVRGPSAQSGVQKGWGIGLTLVQGIVEAHGGRVRIESVMDEGTTFKVDLPKDSRVGQKDVTTRV